MAPRMHAGELDIGTDLVRRLLRAQLPRWADRPLRRVPSSGTDNAMFRLGDDLAVRLPRIDWAVAAIEKEQRWLPVLARHLPLPVPEPVAGGAPGEGYPWPWSVYRWLDGADALAEPVTDLTTAAGDLIRLLLALRAADPAGAPTARRGRPLATAEGDTRRAIARSHDLVDVAAVTAAWDEALAAPDWDGPPVWVHGDVARGNLLVRDGRLAALIDFGSCGTGDPACDLIVAWDLLDPPSRELLRAGLDVDGATWARGRGWALSTAVQAFPYYLHTNPPMVAQARHKIAAVLAERR